jgi:hypothetical protein
LSEGAEGEKKIAEIMEAFRKGAQQKLSLVKAAISQKINSIIKPN